MLLITNHMPIFNVEHSLGLDESVNDHQAAWDLVDRILSSGLHVARMKSPNIFRLFYPESRDSIETTSVKKASGYYKEDV